MKYWKRIPTAARWILVTLAIIAVTSSITFAAYKALHSEGTVQIDECLSWVGSNTFEVQLYPQESETVTLTIRNVSSLPIDVELVDKINPKIKGLEVTMPDVVTVPAGGDLDVDILVAAGKDCEPGACDVTIDVER